MPELSPCRTVWRHHGEPSVAVVDRAVGQCATCRQIEVDVVPLETVVSRNFTDWDRLVPGLSDVCLACAWAFSDASVRLLPQVITPARVSTEWYAVEMSLMGPVVAGSALVVPVGGRKHLLPFADWRSISTDWGLVTWDAAAVELFSAVRVLRRAGMSEAAMRSVEGLPPAHSSVEPREVLKAFSVLRLWRGSPQLQVALRSSRPSGGEGGG